MYFQSKRAADFALSRAGLVQSGSLSGIVELDKTARELGDVGCLHHSASEDEDLNDELDLMVLSCTDPSIFWLTTRGLLQIKCVSHQPC